MTILLLFSGNTVSACWLGDRQFQIAPNVRRMPGFVISDLKMKLKYRLRWIKCLVIWYKSTILLPWHCSKNVPKLPCSEHLSTRVYLKWFFLKVNWKRYLETLTFYTFWSSSYQENTVFRKHFIVGYSWFMEFLKERNSWPYSGVCMFIVVFSIGRINYIFPRLKTASLLSL